MKARKIFAAIVALAMIAAVIPAFGLTASAYAPSREKVESMQLSDWGSMAGTPVFTAPTAPSSITPVADVYEGWSASWEKELNMDDPDGIVNINAKSDGIQVYGPTGSSDTLTLPGYGEGKDFVIFEFWGSRVTGDNNISFAHDMRFVDLDGKFIENYTTRKDNGIYSGDTDSVFAGEAPVPADDKTESTILATGYHTGVRIIFVNNDDDTHSVLYYIADDGNKREPSKNTYTGTYQNNWTNGSWANVYTATYEGTFNGLGSIDFKVRHTGKDWEQASSLNFIRIYEGDITNSTTATVKYVDTADNKVVDSYEVTRYIGETVTPKTHNYYVDPEANFLYTMEPAEAVEITMEDQVIEVPLTRFKAVAGKNAISNPSFEEGFAGWYGTFSKDSEPVALENKPESDNYIKLTVNESLVSEGKQALEANSNSNNGYPWLVNEWAVEPDTDYILAFDIMSRNKTNQFAWFALTGDDGAEEYIYDYADSSGTGGQINGLVKNQYVQKVFFFHTKENQTKLTFDAHWLNDSNGVYDNFMLYPLAASLEAPTAALGWNGESFTIDFSVASGNAIYVYKNGNTDAAAPSFIAELEEGETGAALSTTDTNALYQAKAVDNGVYGESGAPVSIYSLVADAIASFKYDGEINAEQLKVAVNVINAGGIYIIKNADGTLDLTEEGNKLMTLDAEAETITLKENVYNAGIRFESTKYAVGDEADSTAVSEDGKTVKIEGLSAMGTLSEYVIYLEDVEFVLDDMVETVVDNEIYGELEFIEEI
ncbi:MAG: hypothetical protein J1F63_04715 [Oscillospiraceae bacterium]|nr:hypothetical protein [Oscillospiraceae bacterium]